MNYHQLHKRAYYIQKIQNAYWNPKITRLRTFKKNIHNIRVADMYNNI